MKTYHHFHEIFYHCMAIILVLLSITGLTACKAKPAVFSTQFLGTFDTIISVTVHTPSEDEFREISEYVEERFIQLNQLFDIYNDYEGIHNMKTINDQAGISPVTVDPEIIQLLLLSKEWYDKTSGKFNIAFGSVLNIWHEYRLMADPEDENPLVPAKSLLEAAALHTSIDDVLIDEKNHTVYISDPKLRIDVGGVAKGYTTEIVTNELLLARYKNFAINAGGNIRAIGSPIARGNEKWAIGIQNPDKMIRADLDEDIIGKVLVTNTSVVTSGWYQRYFISGDTIYHHIIDPDTLYPRNYYQAVTVVYPNAGICDILSTTFMLLSPDESTAFIESIPGAQAIWILDNQEIRMTAGMHSLFVKKTS